MKLKYSTVVTAVAIAAVVVNMILASLLQEKVKTIFTCRAKLKRSEELFKKASRDFFDYWNKEKSKKEKIFSFYESIIYKDVKPGKRNGRWQVRVDTKGLSDEEAAIKRGVALLPYIKKKWGPLVDKVIHEGGFNVNKNLVFAHMAIESGGYQYALSDSGAIGLMQIMPATAVMYGRRPRDLVKPYTNIYCGIRHIEEAMKRRHINSEDWLIVSYLTGYGKKSLDYSKPVKEVGDQRVIEYYKKVSGVLSYMEEDKVLCRNNSPKATDLTIETGPLTY